MADIEDLPLPVVVPPDTSDSSLQPKHDPIVAITKKGDTLIGCLRAQASDHVRQLWDSGYFGQTSAEIKWQVVAESVSLYNKHTRGANWVEINDRFALPPLPQSVSSGLTLPVKIIEGGPTQARDLTTRGFRDIRAKGENHNLAGGEENFLQALNIETTDFRPFLGLGEVEVERGNYEAAKSHLQLARERGGEKGNQEVDALAKRIAKEAEQQFRSGDTFGALNKIEVAHDVSPENQMVLRTLRKINLDLVEQYVAAGNLSAARQLIEETRQLAGAHSEWEITKRGQHWASVARQSAKDGDFLKAFHAGETALVFCPENKKFRTLNAALHVQRMDEYHRDGRDEEAAEESRKVLDLTNGLESKKASRLRETASVMLRKYGVTRLLESIYAQAEALVAKGQWEAASSKYEAAIKYGDRSHRPWLEIAQLRADGHGSGSSVTLGGSRRKGSIPRTPQDEEGVKGVKGVLLRGMSAIPSGDVAAWQKAVRIGVKSGLYAETNTQLLAAIDQAQRSGDYQAAHELGAIASQLAQLLIDHPSKLTSSSTSPSGDNRISIRRNDSGQGILLSKGGS